MICTVYYLLLVKLSTYGFDSNWLERFSSFLKGKKFKAKIGSSYSPNHEFSKMQAPYYYLSELQKLW